MERKQEPLGFYKTRRENGSGFRDISGILPAIFGLATNKMREQSELRWISCFLS